MSQHHLALLCGQLQSASVCSCQENNYLLLFFKQFERVTIHSVERPFLVLTRDTAAIATYWPSVLTGSYFTLFPIVFTLNVGSVIPPTNQ